MTRSADDWMTDRNHWRNRFMPAAIITMFAIWFVLVCLIGFTAFHFVVKFW